MLFSLLKHYLDLYISDTALKVFQSLYCFTTSVSHGVENYFPRLWGKGISDTILILCHYMHYPFLSVIAPAPLHSLRCSEAFFIFVLFHLFYISWCPILFPKFGVQASLILFSK